MKIPMDFSNQHTALTGTNFFLMRTVHLLVALIILCTSIYGQSGQPGNSRVSNLIPKPGLANEKTGSFLINDQTQVYISQQNDTLLNLANDLVNIFHLQNRHIKLLQDQTPVSNNILISLSTNNSLGDEGYELKIDVNGVYINANKPAGVFYAIQTLRQLLPDEIESDKKINDLSLQACDIVDLPRFPYRGSMLDVARHFFSVEDVKRYIDLIAFYKMNVLHLGLTNDQGWRIEIKSWPNLTSIGGSSSVNGNKPGFYTQEQYKDIVAYAQNRFITIVPEIDMPGHTNAALASYAILNCNDTAPALYTGMKVGFSSLCVRKEITYKFIDDVVGEIATLTPGPWIHIGGDESHATTKADYKYFIERAAGIVTQHGKNVIGWDEIGNADLPENSIAEYWARDSNALAAVKQGAKLIMAPAKNAYLDMQYDNTTKLGLHWAGYIEVNDAYMWEPTQIIKGITEDDIIGIEAPLWTETLDNFDDVAYMAFPRLIGLAEIGWTMDSNRNWEEYKLRLANHASRMKALDINFYPSKLVPWPKNN